MLWLAVFLAAVLPVLIWPGDVSFTNDEPRLLAIAWHANQSGWPASGGLYGNFGLRYGPLPAQIYQVLLSIASDPIALAALRSMLCAGVTFFSLLWMARVLVLPPWFAVAIALAPQVWYFQRVLWDASFSIPLGTLALAACTALFQKPSRGRLLLTIGSAALLLFIHPQNLPLAGAIAGAVLWHARDALRRHHRAVLLVLGAVCALNAGYLVFTISALVERLGGAIRSGYPEGQPRALALLAPLLGGNLLSESGFGGKVAPAEHLPAFWRLAAGASLLVHPLIWSGLVVAAGQAFRRWPARNEEVSQARVIISQVALATLGLQALIFGLMRVPAEPQYFFGTFAVHALLAWFAVDGLRWKQVGRGLGLAFALGVAALTIGGMIAIHQHGYAPEPARVPLQNQVEIARALNRFPDATVLTDVPFYQQYPQALRTLRLLIPARPGEMQPVSGKRVIRRVPGTARLELADLQDAALTPGSVSVSVTGLPKDWQPPPAAPAP